MYAFGHRFHGRRAIIDSAGARWQKQRGDLLQGVL